MAVTAITAAPYQAFIDHLIYYSRFNLTFSANLVQQHPLNVLYVQQNGQSVLASGLDEVMGAIMDANKKHSCFNVSFTTLTMYGMDYSRADEYEKMKQQVIQDKSIRYTFVSHPNPDEVFFAKTLQTHAYALLPTRQLEGSDIRQAENDDMMTALFLFAAGMPVFVSSNSKMAKFLLDDPSWAKTLLILRKRSKFIVDVCKNKRHCHYPSCYMHWPSSWESYIALEFTSLQKYWKTSRKIANHIINYRDHIAKTYQLDMRPSHTMAVDFSLFKKQTSESTPPPVQLDTPIGIQLPLKYDGNMLLDDVPATLIDAILYQDSREGLVDLSVGDTRCLCLFFPWQPRNDDIPPPSHYPDNLREFFVYAAKRNPRTYTVLDLYKTLKKYLSQWQRPLRYLLNIERYFDVSIEPKVPTPHQKQSSTPSKKVPRHDNKIVITGTYSAIADGPGAVATCTVVFPSSTSTSSGQCRCSNDLCKKLFSNQEEKHCSSCGTERPTYELLLHCPTCHEKYEDQANFCSRDGTQLVSTSETFKQNKRQRCSSVSLTEPIQFTSSSSSSSSDSSEPKNSNYECRICYDAPIATIIEPCGHTVLCNKCANTIVQSQSPCPICKVSITRVAKLFFC